MFEVARSRDVLLVKPPDALGLLEDGAIIWFLVKGDCFRFLFLQEEVLEALQHATPFILTAWEGGRGRREVIAGVIICLKR